jgi:C4-dicarboxylate-specific signal transduction histidine kinase
MNEKEIQFIGKITAGVTHEVNNVLASIREISGLMTDILSITDEKSFPRKEKFQTSLEKIQNQVQRGVKLTSQLNKFSHLPDNNKIDVDLNELIEHLIFLTERFARIKNITLQNQSSTQSIILHTDPFLMQMALFNCISFLLNKMANGSEISISPQKKGNECSVSISCKGEVIDKALLFKDSSSANELLSLNSIMQKLNGLYELDELNATIIIKISSKN